MTPELPNDIEPLMKRLWQLLDLANALATASDAADHFEKIAALCDSAADAARTAAASRQSGAN